MKIENGVLKNNSGPYNIGCYRNEDRSCGEDCPACEISKPKRIPGGPLTCQVSLHCLNRIIKGVPVLEAK